MHNWNGVGIPAGRPPRSGAAGRPPRPDADVITTARPNDRPACQTDQNKPFQIFPPSSQILSPGLDTQCQRDDASFQN